MIRVSNALRSAIPPLLSLLAKKMLPAHMEGKTVEVDGSATTSDWSKSDLFMTYMKGHFLKYVQGRDGETLLVLYDGHCSHTGIDLIEWASDNNIIFFVISYP